MRRVFLSLIIFLIPGVTSAQSLGLGDVSEPVSISVSPDYPAPFSTAVLSTVSSTIDLSASSMVVSVNGKRIYSGAVTQVPVPLQGAGVVQHVSVDITSRGETTHKDLSIQPEDVTLIAEPLSSAPPLYAGKQLIPLGGETRLVALANLRTSSGTVIDPRTASYRWTVNDAYRTGSSGIGKSSILLSSPLQYRSSTVSVVVTSPDGNLVGGDTFTFYAQQPSLRTYERDPLLGVRFNKALPENYTISGTEATLFAGAYSFPTDNPLSLEWFVNGTSVHKGSTVTLRPSGNGKGTSPLSLVGSTAGSEKTSLGMSLSFGTNSSNLFGL